MTKQQQQQTTTTTVVEDIKEATGTFIENETLPRLEENDATLCEGMVSLEETT